MRQGYFHEAALSNHAAGIVTKVMTSRKLAKRGSSVEFKSSRQGDAPAKP